MAYLNGKNILFEPHINMTVEVDDELSETSTNPVQNKVITTELREFATDIETEFAAVYAAIEGTLYVEGSDTV